MISELSIDQKATEAANHLASLANQPIPFGIILGTGSGIVAKKMVIETEIDYGDIPHFPQSTALGHKGSLLFGKLNSHHVVAMNGRFHLYEGHNVDDAKLALRVLQKLGVTNLFITNAAGGLNPNFNSGDIMIINSHIDLMCRTSPNTNVQSKCERPSKRTDIYDLEMAENARSIARANDFNIQTGIYGGLLGPNYETRAEYRMLRRIGADVAGMSTIPEVCMAATLQMKVLGLSIVTNVAKPDVLQQTSGQEVINAAELAAPRIHQIILGSINKLGR